MTEIKKLSKTEYAKHLAEIGLTIEEIQKVLEQIRW